MGPGLFLMNSGFSTPCVQEWTAKVLKLKVDYTMKTDTALFIQGLLLIQTTLRKLQCRAYSL